MRVGPHGHGEPPKRLKVDPQLFQELALCEDFRVSHSHYLGGPALWTELDRAKAQAYRRLLADLCSTCRTDPALWTVDDEGIPAMPFVARAVQCPGCDVIEALQEQIQRDKNAPRGLHIHLEPRVLAGVG